MTEPLEDVIGETMETYWRVKAETLTPDARNLLNHALDIFAESRDTLVSSEGEGQNGP